MLGPYALVGATPALAELVRKVTDMVDAVKGTQAFSTFTVDHVGAPGEPATPAAILTATGTLDPPTTRYTTSLPCCLIDSGYLFAVPSVFIQPTRALCVYPDGIVGDVADKEIRPDIFEPSQITHTLYHVLTARIPESRLLVSVLETRKDARLPALSVLYELVLLFSTTNSSNVTTTALVPVVDKFRFLNAPVTDGGEANTGAPAPVDWRN